MSELPDDILDVLETGTLDVQGMLPWSSNYTFLIRLCRRDETGAKIEVEAVYKPRRGERPLWDFASGSLCQRERAAFLVSDAMGWDLVPPTVLRDGPHGIGSVQYFVDHDPDRHYFTFEGDPELRPQLQRIALFDVVANNADRKSGHVLIAKNGGATPPRLWGIDHGICFHSEHKLRTVIWEFAGETIPVRLVNDLKRFRERLSHNDDTVTTKLADLLSQREITALQKRVERLIDTAVFPQPGPGRHYPWPPV